MRIHRVHTPQSLKPGLEVRIGEKQAHYLRRVLRVTVGQRLVLFNGDGHDYASEVLRPGKNEMVISVVSRLPAARESGLKITVVQCISRGERMDQTLQKCTELGASGFQPLFSERVEVRLRPEKQQRRLQHWQAVVVAACEQSGRAVVPRLENPSKFADWLDDPFAGQTLVLVPGSDTPLARVTLSSEVRLVAGPEGGFSDVELELMEARGMQAVSLGPRILRTETAAPAAVAVLQSLAGDFA